MSDANINEIDIDALQKAFTEHDAARATRRAQDEAYEALARSVEADMRSRRESLDAFEAAVGALLEEAAASDEEISR